MSHLNKKKIYMTTILFVCMRMMRALVCVSRAIYSLHRGALTIVFNCFYLNYSYSIQQYIADADTQCTYYSRPLPVAATKMKKNII